jgi:hypothetical protein
MMTGRSVKATAGRVCGVVAVVVASSLGAGSAGAQSSCPAPNPLRYNEVQQKAIHNAYLKAEALLDQLVYHRVRSFELDLHARPRQSSLCTSSLYDAPNDWYVYHTIGEFRGDKLSDYLKLFAAYHRAVPKHEVITLGLELKGNDGTSCGSPFGGGMQIQDMQHPNRRNKVKNRLTPEGLDQRLRDELGDGPGRDWLFTPRDLLAACPGATSLRDALLKCKWPTLEALRGKFILLVLYDDETYSQNFDGSLAVNERAAFIAPSDQWRRLMDRSYRPPGHVVFHTEVGDTNDNIRKIRENFPEMILRTADGKDLEFSGPSGQGLYHLIKSDHPSGDERVADGRTFRTHTKELYPFCPTGVPGRICFSGPHRGSSLREVQHLLGLSVTTGDIDGTRDSFVFAVDKDPPNDGESTWTAFVSVASNATDVHQHAKGCLMARASESASAPYYAVCRHGDNREITVHYRDAGCGGACGTANEEAHLAHDGFDGEDAIFLRLEVRPDGRGSHAQAWGSWDGRTWQRIGQGRTFPVPLSFRGLAASSNEPLYNHLPARLYFGNVRRNGERRFLRDFRLSSVGGDSCLSVDGAHRCLRDAVDYSFLPSPACGGEP